MSPGDCLYVPTSSPSCGSLTGTRGRLSTRLTSLMAVPNSVSTCRWRVAFSAWCVERAHSDCLFGWRHTVLRKTYSKYDARRTRVDARVYSSAISLTVQRIFTPTTVCDYCHSFYTTVLFCYNLVVSTELFNVQVCSLVAFLLAILPPSPICWPMEAFRKGTDTT